MANNTTETADNADDDIISYSPNNLQSDDFSAIFHNLGMPEKDAKKISNECGEWDTFIAEHHEDTPNTLKSLKMSEKSISISMFARCKVLFDNASLHDIANMNID